MQSPPISHHHHSLSSAPSLSSAALPPAGFTALHGSPLIHFDSSSCRGHPFPAKMLCASTAAAARAVAPAAQRSNPSRPRPHRPHASAVPPCATFVADGMLGGSSRLPLTARLPRSAATGAAEAAEESLEMTPDAVDEAKERLEVVVKGNEGKPRVVLKFIWMEKNIGLALDHVIAGHGTVPLSPYCFWPRKDAWEELKALLESKPWISQKCMIILLNQATEIINLWQQSGAGNLQQ